jgi:hypothetical protein
VREFNKMNKEGKAMRKERVRMRDGIEAEKENTI